MTQRSRADGAAEGILQGVTSDDPTVPAPADDAPPAQARRSRRDLLLPAGLVLAGVAMAVAAVVLGTRGGGGDDAPSGSASPWSLDDVDLDRYAADLLEASQEAHVAAGLPAWEASACAQPQAALRAQDLVGEELVHAPLDPVLAACAPLTTAAENLSRAAASAPDVVDAWMGSAGHRSNIEDPAFTEAATACVVDGDRVLCSLVLAGP